MLRIFHTIKSLAVKELFDLPKSPRRQMLLLLTALTLGVIAGVFAPIPFASSYVWFEVVACSVIMILFAIVRREVNWSLLALGVMFAGYSSGALVGSERRELSHLIGKEINGIGTVSDFARFTGTSYRFTIDVKSLGENFNSFPLRATSMVLIPRGSEVELKCRLRIRGNSFECSTASVRKIADPPWYLQILNDLREATFGKVSKFLTPDRAALLAGMVYGGDDTLPTQMRNNFRSAGLSHLIAVSGANLALVTVLFYGMLTAFFLSRRPAAIVALAVLGLTVAFVGFDASVVRAGIMGSLLLVGALVGRERSKGNALMFAAALMLFLNPWMIFDLGFLLSVSATAGLMFLSGGIEEKIKFIPEFGALRSSVALTLSALISTLPIIALTLGQVQLISPFSNLLAAPLVTIIFALGIVFCLTSWLPMIPVLLAPILSFFLDLLGFVAALFASVPLGIMKGSSAIVSAVIVSITAIIWILYTKKPGESLPKQSR
ncbi:MAG: ComEC/Rec2 family competence protein [bacterium]